MKQDQDWEANLRQVIPDEEGADRTKAYDEHGRNIQTDPDSPLGAAFRELLRYYHALGAWVYILIILAIAGAFALLPDEQEQSRGALPAASTRVTYVVHSPHANQFVSIDWHDATGSHVDFTMLKRDWVKRFDARPGKTLYVEVFNEDSWGEVECRIEADGKLLAKRSAGANGTATCSAVMPG